MATLANLVLVSKKKERKIDIIQPFSTIPPPRAERKGRGGELL